MCISPVCPVFALAHLPTPLAYLSNLACELNGLEILVKRDDRTGLASRGNKTCKLELPTTEARQQDTGIVRIQGAAQSNHTRPSAAAASHRRARALEWNRIH